MASEIDIRDGLFRVLLTYGIDSVPTAIHLEHPEDMSHGDFSTNIALSYAKQLGLSPQVLAKKFVAELGEIITVERIEIAGPGFINFFLKPDVFANTISAISHEPSHWGKNQLHIGEKIMVEFTDPNPFKEFHIGHLMSNAIGESVSRLLEYAGARVTRVNYQGDVGPHVAKAVWALQKFNLDSRSAAELGRAYAAGATAYEKEPEAKQEIDVINTQIYDRSNPVVNEIYDAGRKTSLKHFEAIYVLLGTKFDHYFFESETAPRGIALVRNHLDVFTESEGAIVYQGEKDGLHTRVFITSRATPTYEAKDLGLLAMKQEYGALDRSITVTAHEQADYFAVMLAAARHMPELAEIAEKTSHLSHGMMRFAEGKMSSRTGNVITGEGLLAELADAAGERAIKSRATDAGVLAAQIAVGAIKFQILRQSSGKDIVFDRSRALSLEGDSGPYLQYTHARTEQVVAKAKVEEVVAIYNTETRPSLLVRLVAHFPLEVRRATELREPHLVATYLTELSAVFNRWYAEEKILDGTPEAAHKVAVTNAVRVTLKNGLYLLGIPAPEQM